MKFFSVTFVFITLKFKCKYAKLNLNSNKVTPINYVQKKVLSLIQTCDNQTEFCLVPNHSEKCNYKIWFNSTRIGIYFSHATWREKIKTGRRNNIL